MLFRVPAQVLRGFFMGAADVVPGVSGGTIALVLGIYERLVHQVRQAALAGTHVLRLDLRGAGSRVAGLDWGFLVPLVSGILLAVVSLARLIDDLLEERPVDVAAVFFGLVVGSIVVAWHRLAARDNPRLLVMAVSAVATFWLLGFRGEDVADPAWWAVLGAGALAICAMILPGVSGSFILVMLGLYDHVLDAVNGREVAVLAVFVVGAVLGLALFSSALDWLLRRHHETVLAALIGLMIGSLRVLWPWPLGADSSRLHAPPVDGWFGPLVLAVIGALLVLGVVGLGSGRRARAHVSGV